MPRYLSKNAHGAAIQHVQEKYKKQTMNRVDSPTMQPSLNVS